MISARARGAAAPLPPDAAEIGAEQNSTIVFPLPIDLIKPLLTAPRPPRRGRRRGNGELPAGARPGELPRGAATPAVRTRRTRDRTPR